MVNGQCKSKISISGCWATHREACQIVFINPTYFEIVYNSWVINWIVWILSILFYLSFRSYCLKKIFIINAITLIEIKLIRTWIFLCMYRDWVCELNFMYWNWKSILKLVNINSAFYEIYQNLINQTRLTNNSFLLNLKIQSMILLVKTNI